MENSYPPELYAKLHLGNPGDLAFYREQCRGASTILELGCGYGRVLEALLGEDRRLVGLDLDRGLLELAQRRLRDLDLGRPELVQGDMRHFAFGSRFDRILIPYSALYCLLSIDDVLACLSQIAEHLAPDGRLVFDAYSVDVLHRESLEEHAGEEEEEGDPSEQAEEVASIVHEGIVYHVVEQSDWSRQEQRLHVAYVHEPRQGGPSIATHLEHRYLLSEQIAPLLDASGLRLVSLTGDYDGTPISDDTELIIATAQLA